MGIRESHSLRTESLHVWKEEIYFGWRKRILINIIEVDQNDIRLLLPATELTQEEEQQDRQITSHQFLDSCWNHSL